MKSNCRKRVKQYKTDIEFPNMPLAKAVGVDVLNGTEQELVLSERSGTSLLENMLIRDYPLLIRLSPRATVATP